MQILLVWELNSHFNIAKKLGWLRHRKRHRSVYFFDTVRLKRGDKEQVMERLPTIPEYSVTAPRQGADQ
jgi:hypothetical protein